MTLLVTLYGPDYAILLSDRRLSSNGIPVDEEANKAAVVTFEDARLACAFTGLARTASFTTEDWLLDELGAAASPDFLSAPTLLRLKDRAIHAFSTNVALRSLPKNQKRLAVLFAGFHYAPEGIYPVGAFLTNFSGFAGVGDLPCEPDTFVLRQIVMDQPTGVAFMGAWQAIEESDVAALNKMLSGGKKADAVLGKAIEVMHSAAERRLGGTIGGQLSSVIVPADKGRAIEAGYHVRNCSPVIYSPNIAFLTRTNAVLIKGMKTSETDPNEKPAAVPKVHRNAPCPCGSALRYRECHGVKPRPSLGVRIR